MLGQPITRSLVVMGNQVRVLVRNSEKARQMFGDEIDIVNFSQQRNGCTIARSMSLPYSVEAWITSYFIKLVVYGV